MAKATKPNIFLAPVLAWLIPGAGHFYLGRRLRALILFVVIGGLFWGGVAFGGVMTVDSRGERWWFMAQINAGIHGLIGWYRSRTEYQEIEAELAQPDTSGGPAFDWSTGHDQRIQQSLRDRGVILVSPTAPVAYVFAGVAGLLNLLVVFDAFMLAAMGRFGEPDPTDAEGRKEPVP